MYNQRTYKRDKETR